MDRQNFIKNIIPGSRKTIKVDKLKKIIEPFLHEFLDKNEYEIFSIEPHNLISHNRLDIIYKTFFLEGLEYKDLYSHNGYLEHIKAFNFGNFKEFGNPDKNSAEKFIEDFLSLDKNIIKNGFNSKKSLIPLSNNFSILNGSHRLASSFYRKKNVTCVQIDHPPFLYDYQFFINRLVDFNRLQDMVYNYIKSSKSCYLALFWPRASLENEKIKKLFPNIVFFKEINLSLNGLDNLIKNVYKDEKWIGNIRNNYIGSMSKTSLCFSSNKKLKLVVFDKISSDQVISIKSKVRQICKVGNHSIHTTDNQEETLTIARLLLFENSINLLNTINNNYLSIFNTISSIENQCKINNINTNNFILDHNNLLNLFGLTKFNQFNQISIYSKNNKPINLKNINLTKLDFSDKRINEIFSYPKNYLWFNNLKIISLHGIINLNKIGRLNINRSILKKIKSQKEFSFLKSWIYFKPHISYLLNISKSKISILKKYFLNIIKKYF